MPITKVQQASLQQISSQIKVSIVQGLLATLGPDHTIKITDSNIQVESLQPVGTKVSVRLVLDAYPVDKEKEEAPV